MFYMLIRYISAVAGDLTLLYFSYSEVIFGIMRDFPVD